MRPQAPDFTRYLSLNKKRGMHWLATAVLMGSVTVSSLPMHAQNSVPERTATLNAIFTEYWEDYLRHSPETATFLGDKRYNDRWSDYSATGFADQLQRERGFIERLGAIDTTGLSDQDKLSSELLMRSLIDDQESARFKEWEMPVNQFNGLHTQVPQLVAATAFETTKDYDDYIKRLQTIDTPFSQVTTSMESGMNEGRMPPKILLEKVLVQVNALLAIKPADSPFAAPLKKFPASVNAADRKRISEAVMAAITAHVMPSYQRLGKFLSATYIPKGRKEPGIWSIPDGNAYYAFRIRQSTTLTKSADEIHNIGLAEVKRDEDAMLAIAKKMGFSDLKSFNAAIKTNPKLHPTSKQQLIDAYTGHINDMKAKLPQMFGTLPKAPLEVAAVPEYMEKQQAAAYYEPGTPDGKRPGHVFVNTYNFADRGLEGAEAISYHEGLPGHHLQISIAQELTGLPEFRKQAYYTAYTEGWGLYSERLGKEVGFYQDPYSDYGRLEGDIWRAIRLVVDTGVHSKHWSRQQMVDFFHEHSSIDETNIQSEVDRYIAWPAQALGYKMGQLKLIELRERAQKALGPKFDVRKFHDLVIDSGALPLDVLDKRVDDWIATQK
jgi:uncharacterized protein (DUF885 family)